jgi:hypothetical protein
MTTAPGLPPGLLRTAETAWPFAAAARLCDLRPRFIDKSAAGRGRRAISRNGRVLLCSDRLLAELTGRPVRLRFQTWNRVILPGDSPAPYGVLLQVRLMDGAVAEESTLYTARLVRTTEAAGDLILDLGGGTALELRRPDGEAE